MMNLEQHQEVCESLRKWANAIARDGVYSGLEVFNEDLHDGRITYLFSLTPQKGA